MCIVASVTFYNATLGAHMGYQFHTGAEAELNQTNEDLSGDIGGDVTESGDFSPLAAFSILSEGIALLFNAPEILSNLGIPDSVVRWMTTPLTFVGVIVVVSVVLGRRL